MAVDLIGSDLHFYRGTEGPATDFTLGHELLGEIVDVGKGIQKFKKGDLVIAPFSLSCGKLETHKTPPRPPPTHLYHQHICASGLNTSMSRSLIVKANATTAQWALHHDVINPSLSAVPARRVPKPSTSVSH